MQVVAHPDDEDGGLLTLEARGHGVSTLLMTLNRGEGGQNKIGSNLSDVLGVVRSGEVPGRGDTVYNKWNFAEAQAKNPPLTKAGVVNADQFWERIDYFLSHAENKVRIACHPQDPGMPPEGYRGITNVLGTIDGLKRSWACMKAPITA